MIREKVVPVIWLAAALFLLISAIAIQNPGVMS